MTEAPDFSAMTDEEFDAHWEARTEAAAQHAARTGDEGPLEASMTEHGEAIWARWPA